MYVYYVCLIIFIYRSI